MAKFVPGVKFVTGSHLLIRTSRPVQNPEKGHLAMLYCRTVQGSYRPWAFLVEPLATLSGP